MAWSRSAGGFLTRPAAGSGVVVGLSSQSAIQNAINNNASVLWVQPGDYTFTRAGVTDVVLGAIPFCFLVNGGQRLSIRVTGGGRAIFRFPSSTEVSEPAACFHLLDSSRILFDDGIEFYGTANDYDYVTNKWPAVYPRGVCDFVTLRGVESHDCTLVSGAFSATARGWLVEDCRVFDSPGNLLVPNESWVNRTLFDNAALRSESSHAIYPFGTFSNLTVTDCRARNINGEFLKWKGNATARNRKRKVVVTGNDLDNMTGGIEFGSDTEEVHEQIVATGNHFRNCRAPFNVYAGRFGLIEQNTILYDYDNVHSGCVGVNVVNAGIGSSGATARGMNLVIARNHIRQLAHFPSRLRIASVPAAGDTVVLGGTTYTWVNGSPQSAVQVQRDGTSLLDVLAKRLADALRGRRAAPAALCPVLASPDGVQVTNANDTTQYLWIDGPKTYSLSVTGTAVVIDAAPTDFRGKAQTGVQLARVEDAILDANVVEDFETTYAVSDCTRVRATRNVSRGWTNSTGTTPWAWHSQGNTHCTYHGNEFEITPATDDTSARRFDINDGMALFGQNPGAEDMSSVTQWRQELGGLSGRVVCGDGKAHNYLWFGNTVLGGVDGYDTVQGLPFRWSAGDTVVLDDGAGHAYTYTYRAPWKALRFYLLNERVVNDTGKIYKMTAASGTSAASGGPTGTGTGITDGTCTWDYVSTDTTGVDFSGYDSLVALMDATAEFTAQGLDTSFKLGWIKVVHAAGGTAGNSATLTVTTKSKTCGQIFRTGFLGGSSAADRTVIWTRAAAKDRQVALSGANSAGNGLAPWIDHSSDVYPGAAYVVRHSTATAGAELGFAVAT